MDLTLLTDQLQAIAVLDIYESLIWNEKYNSFGDFEILVPINTQIVNFLKEDYYLRIPDSDHLMIVEGLSLHSGTDVGSTLKIRGRSLETILERRVVWTKTVLKGNLQTEIQRLLNENAISPSIRERQISRLRFVSSTDPLITSLTIDCQLLGEDLYSVIEQLCKTNGIGFKITLTESDTFIFQFYAGVDRSYNQNTYPYIIFSPEFDNILYGDYIEDISPFKTVSLVGGETGVGSGRATTSIAALGQPENGGSDLTRREMFIDAGSVSKNIDGVVLSDADYITHLKQKGLEELNKSTFVKTFEGQIDTTSMYTYGIDFNIGDIVQVEDEYGHEALSRVVELIRSQDSSGLKIYPTFSSI
jgi:Siphovirus ReqiPepy6 Gp37-like protein